MLKPLLKKQFLELNSFYFQNKKTGKNRSKAGTVGFIVLYAVLFIFLGVSFFAIVDMFAGALVSMDLSWLYFAIVGLLSICFGVFGSVFNTYAGLYHAKDNELLLSMPIPPKNILFVRMVGVYAMGLLYESVVYIPSVIAYFKYAKLTALSVINTVLLLFVIALLILTLTCALGWVVALISSKLKNKSFITVILALVFFGLYYYVCFNYYSAIENLLANVETVSVNMKNAAYPLYLMGRAAEGNAIPMLVFTALVAALAAITYYILSKTFLKIATKKEEGPKAVYKSETPIKVSGVEKALLIKEWKRFSSSATYILNCSLGTVFMLIAAVAVLIFSDRIMPLIELLGESKDIVYIVLMAGVFMLTSMNDISAPSVSLEGKNIWVLQTMPVDSAKALEAKERLHQLLTLPSAVIMTVCTCIAVKADFTTSVMLTMLTVIFVMFMSALGVAVNLKTPNLSWTNETMPIKQSLSVAISLFGGWVLAIALGVIGYFATKHIEAYEYFIVCLVVLSLSTRYLNRWIKTKGAKIFDNL